jgi:hypothetical protein
MKYELTKETIEASGITLFKIKALKSFGNVKAGDLGGYIQKLDNLSQDGHSWVYGNARAYGNAQVYGDAWVYGNARAYGDAQVYGNAEVCFGKIKNNSIYSIIESQTGLKCFDNEVYCYKHVNEDLSSLHNSKFKYKIGSYAIAENPEISNASCAPGLHVSNAQYWNGNEGKKILFCKVHIDDIITVQSGKIRCKKLFVIGVCDGDVF